MSDLPTTLYESGDNRTIDRQIGEAANAGITGFITSWPGPGNTQDANLVRIFARIARYNRLHHTQFVSSLYFESDADAVRHNLARAMRYAIQRYTTNRFFFRWHGRPVIFIWHPIGNGRTLETWVRLRRELDPHHHLLWVAEGTDISLLDVFDGLHLFSAGYWGLLDGTMNAVDASFRTRVDGFDASHGAERIWAAGVQPGYDDRRIPGRAGTYRVPRDGGATYRASWEGAMGSRPDWITISTFNEWFEGSMIEPSRSYGDLYLDLTHYFSYRWRQWNSGPLVLKVANRQG